MTDELRIRNDHDRMTALNEIAAVAQWLTTAPHTVSHLVAAMWRVAEDGIGAQGFDGDGTHGGERFGSTVETRALGGRHRPACPAAQDPDDYQAVCNCPTPSDQAAEDADALDRDILEGWRVIRRIRGRLHYLDAPQHRTRKPGIGECPSGKCEDCWSAEVERSAAQKRYRRWCRLHGDHRNKHGEPMPVVVTKALQACGWNQDHWSVRRAWETVGGKPAA